CKKYILFSLHSKRCCLILAQRFFVSMNKYFILLFLLAVTLCSRSQEPIVDGPLLSLKDENQYDKDLLPASFHQSRRDSLRKLLPEGGLAVFFSSPVRNRAND